MPDSHRLNFHYLDSADRLKEPIVRGEESPAKWEKALAVATEKLKGRKADETAIIASARMTNEELFLVRRLATSLGIRNIDVLPRPQKGDGFLVSDDGNPNTSGAKLLGVATGRLPAIVKAVEDGLITGLVVLGEDATQAGLTEADLAKLTVLVTTAILPSATTAAASHVLPSAGFAEKRGSMINKNNRLQRLNRAIQPPGLARDDWEILAALTEAVTGSSLGFATIEDVVKAMTAATPSLAGLSLSKIGDLGVALKA